jgi:hypothetical protein
MKLLIIFFFTYTLEPSITVTPENEVRIEWKTQNPSTNANVYYTPIPDSFPTVDFLFDFMFNHWDNKRTDTLHSFTLRSVVPGITYVVRVISTDTKTHYPVSSSETTFRIIERNGKKFIGITIKRGPHLTMVDTSSITIFWETNFYSKGWVIYGEKDLTERTPQDTGLHHIIKIRNLKRNTKYLYRVVSATDTDTVLSPIFTFKTAPPPGESVRFAVLGDSRNNWRSPNSDFRLNGVNLAILRPLLFKAFQHGAELIIFVGDLIQGYTEDTTYVKKQYETWLWATWPTSAYIPIYPVMGNHDATAPFKRLEGRDYVDPDPPLSAEDFWRRFFVLPENGPETEGPPYLENVYSLDYGDLHLVILNSDYRYGRIGGKILSKRIDSIQRKWLFEDLKNKSNFVKFVFFHEPAFPVSGHLGSSLDLHEAERDSLWEILVKFKVQAVFCGHEHVYARLLVDNRINDSWVIPIRQIITGRAGAPPYRRSDIPYESNLEKFSRYNHFVKVEKEEDKIFYTVISLIGDTLDKWVEESKK